MNGRGGRLRVDYLPGTPQGECDIYPTRLSLPGGAERVFTYDALGRLAGATDLAGAAWSYATMTDGGGAANRFGVQVFSEPLDISTEDAENILLQFIEPLP